MIAENEGGTPLPVEEGGTEDLNEEDRALLAQMETMRSRHLQWAEAEPAGFVPQGPADKTFRKFIALCRERGIRLVVIHMPIRPDMLKEFRYDQYLQFVSYVTVTCRDEDVKFVNLQDSWIPLQKDDYWDRTHVNRRGAAILSRDIAQDIVIPELQQMQEAQR